MRRDQLETRGRKDRRDHKGFKVLQVRRDRREYKGRRGMMAQRAQQDLRDHKV